MENSKKIIVKTTLILFVFIIGFILLNHEKIYREFAYKKIGNDLYKKNDSIFILQEDVWRENNEDIHLSTFVKTGILNNKEIELTKVIDVETFQKRYDFGDNIYMDKKYFYIRDIYPFSSSYIYILKKENINRITVIYDYILTNEGVYFGTERINGVDFKSFKMTGFLYQGNLVASDKSSLIYTSKKMNINEFVLFCLENRLNRIKKDSLKQIYFNPNSALETGHGF